MRNILTNLKTGVLIIILSTMLCCESKPATTDKPVTTIGDTVPDSVILFLLTSASNDFHTYQPPVPVDFRNVKVGFINSAENEKTYVLCGEMLSEENREAKKWEYFATVKTSGYEHYIGAQALAFCNDAAMASTQTDLSIELKKNFFKQ